MIGIFICFMGAVCVGLSDESDDSSHSLGGDVVALLAAAGYGLYTAVMRLKAPGEDGPTMQLLLGYIGAFNCIILSPVLIIVVGRCFYSCFISIVLGRVSFIIMSIRLS